MPIRIGYIAHPLTFGTELVCTAALFVLLCGLKCAAMTLEELQAAINEMVLRCLMLAQITVPQGAAICGMSESNFRRALSGDEYRNISLVTLCHLPYRFWLHFAPELMWMIAKKHMVEMRQVVGEMADEVLSLRRRA